MDDGNVECMLSTEGHLVGNVYMGGYNRWTELDWTTELTFDLEKSIVPRLLESGK